MKHIFSQIIACIGLGFILVGCSTGPEICEFRPEGAVTLAPKKATGRPYQIKGVWYYPQPYYEYDAVGTASLYGGGDGFHGRPTATGERFDMNKVTAAHKTIPLPCVAKITNLENGRELIVKVNDRGPFVPGRIIDLSRRGAQLLGFEHKGLAQVRVTTLVPESLALNGIDTSGVMMAQSPVPSLTLAAAPASPSAVPIKTAGRSAKPVGRKALLEALKENLETGEEIPIEKELTIAETPDPEPTPPSQREPVVVAEALPSSLPPVKVKPVPSTGIFVHVGEYETYAKAESGSRSLDGFGESPVEIIKNKGPQSYVARLGPLPSMSQANQLLDQLVNAGHLISRIVIQH